MSIILAFIIFALVMNVIFLLMLSELRQEVIDYMLRRDDDEDT